MRLEIEPTLTALALTEDAATQERRDVDSIEAKSALDQGIKAAQAGNRAQARASLLKATEIDPRIENAWLWLASISEYPEELLGFLIHVLEINPENQRAIEWKAATHALLSKTFVQRGIDASQENRKDFAAECFQTALDYDERNAAAWEWMASLSDSNNVKVTLLEKAVAIAPDNDSAAAALSAAKIDILKEHLTEAKTAAVSGNNAEAITILDTLLSVNPDSVDAWTMKSHLADGFDEKIRCFESILAIDPTNLAAQTGRDSLLSIFGTAPAAADAESINQPDAVEHDKPVDGITQHFDNSSIDKSPTQDLEMPVGFSYQPEEPALAATETYIEEENENEAMEFSAEPFGSFAKETAESFETANDSGQLNDDYQPIEVSFETANGPRQLTVEESRTEVSFDTAVEDREIAFPDTAIEDATFSDGVEPLPQNADVPADDNAANFVSDPAIPVPAADLPFEAPEQSPAGDAEYDEVMVAKLESADCPFCHRPNDPQAISCNACLSVLTLSDLELLLANQRADKLMLRRSVGEMERGRSNRQFGVDELVTLGLGHLNLRNLQLGYTCLSEASKLDPNNVVLTGQVNSLLIRLEEITQQEEAHLKMPKGKSILVVDDSATVRKLIAGKLEKCGHDVICANDGVEAMERLEHFVPDLVLLDITMPRMDGYQVCKTIRSNNPTKDVPVVMISGKDGFFDKVRGRMAGTTGYITKPFGPETLMKAVEMYLSGEVPESDEV